MNKIWKKKKKAFTLIELIIVIAIIAILSAIAVPNFMALRDRTRNNADIQSCQTIKKAIEVLVADNTIPSTVQSVFTVTFVSNLATVAATSVTPANDTTQAAAVTTALSNITSPQGTKMTSSDLKAGTATYLAAGGTATQYIITILSTGEVQVYAD